MTTLKQKLVASAQAFAVVAAAATVLGGLSVGEAEAKTVTKPQVVAHGMYYKKKSKAVDSAHYRWGLKAAEQYGASFAHWGKAKQKNMKCNWVDVPGKPNVEAWRCRASAKPAKEVMVCKGLVSAKGKFYVKKDKAKESAEYRWSLKVADVHGAGFAHWGKSANRDYSCKKGSGAKQLWTCTATALACK